jgi:hypothetical protein
MAVVGSWDSDAYAMRTTLRPRNSFESSATRNFGCSWRCALHLSFVGGVSSISTMLGRSN